MVQRAVRVVGVQDRLLVLQESSMSAARGHIKIIPIRNSLAKLVYEQTMYQCNSILEVKNERPVALESICSTRRQHQPEDGEKYDLHYDKACCCSRERP